MPARARAAWSSAANRANAEWSLSRAGGICHTASHGRPRWHGLVGHRYACSIALPKRSAVATRCAGNRNRRERRPMAANLPAAAAPPVTARVFAGDAGQVRAARRFVAGALDGCTGVSDALLCVSELATNAVLHSRSGRPGGRFTVRATRQAGSVRVEVTDEGGPWGHERDGDGQGGRGRG